MLSLICRVAIFVSLASGLIPTADQVGATVGKQADRSLAEHSGEIFFGTIDIVTYVEVADTNGDGPACFTGYTVLVFEVLKGNLKPQSIIVVQQMGCVMDGRTDFSEDDGPLTPGHEYLFFARFVPNLPGYRITRPVDGNVLVASPEQRADLVAHWSKVVKETYCPYTDVLTLEGVVYTRRDWNDDKRYLDRDRVGPTIATVLGQDTTANGCRDDLVDRTASDIPAGTKIQSVDGYAPTFRVAVRLPDRHRYLYEAIWNANAKTGADLLDIRDRVASVTWADNSDCPEGAACQVAEVTTNDPVRIASVVDLVLGAPAEQDEHEVSRSPATGIFLTFNLDDGSAVDLSVDADTGLSQFGIRVPFDELRAALRGRS